MKDLVIRNVTNTEAVKLMKIAIESFVAAFGKQNSQPDMDEYLRQSFSRAQLQKELQNPDSFFYFAEKEEQVTGYLKINRGKAQTEQFSERAIELERIYVLPKFYGKGIGQQLFRKVLEIAEQEAADMIWLGVWEKNVGAIRFYKRNGFLPFGEHVFMLGSDRQTDILMKLSLSDE